VPAAGYRVVFTFIHIDLH